MLRLTALRAARAYAAAAPRPLVLVPTMGALHAGHAALVRRARRLAGRGGSVVVSIFVNPSQFGAKEDLSRYPRPLERDLAVCREEGASAVFLPAAGAMYAKGGGTAWVVEEALSADWCGASRRGHFRGVCTVVAKLFHLFDPDVAVFGEKDWQQLAVVRRMVSDLLFRVRIVGHPTVREPSGLAMSSRNAYLTAAGHRVAVRFAAIVARAARSPRPAAAARAALDALDGLRVDYVALVDGRTLRALRKPAPGARLLAAAYVGSTRLIDNRAVGRARRDGGRR